MEKKDKEKGQKSNEKIKTEMERKKGTKKIKENNRNCIEKDNNLE